MRRFIALIIGFICVLIVGSIMDIFDNKETNEELISFYGESTVNYFKTFDCSKLDYQEYEMGINNFFLIVGTTCKLGKYSASPLNAYRLGIDNEISNIQVKNIDSANVIVWINILKDGERFGNYTNGALAIRNNYEINLIDKINKTIFKKSVFASVGEPPEKIVRKSGDDKPQYFGDIPKEQVIEFIKQNMN